MTFQNQSISQGEPLSLADVLSADQQGALRWFDETHTCRLHGPFRARIVMLGDVKVSDGVCPECERLKKLADERERAKIEAQRAAEEARHVVADSFELYLPAYWDGRVEADVEGDSVTIRSSEYRRLDICTITVQDGPSQVMGDIATSCMGSVPLGGGKYAVVWANRWAYIIGDAYMRNSSDSSDYYSLDEASEIVDLQTGGAYTYIEIRDDMVATDRASDLLFSSDPYLQEVVVNAIEPR